MPDVSQPIRPSPVSSLFYTLSVHFQPIVSVRRGTVLGVEALARAFDANNKAIPPTTLFEYARQRGDDAVRALDEHCHQLALDAFLPLHQAYPSLMLFLNVDAASLEQAGNAPPLPRQIRERGIDPRNVVAEILERQISDVQNLQAAVANYHAAGMLVAVDDLGAGESNLARVAIARPDLIKTDRSLIQGIDSDFYRQEVFKALVQLSERIGGWIITEGVETQAEAITTLDLGGDLLQGFFLARPQTPSAAVQNGKEHLQETGETFRRFTLQKRHRERQAQEERQALARQVRDIVCKVPPTKLEATLQAAIVLYDQIESACVLDATGTQITDTVLAPRVEERQKTVIFAPPGRGSQHGFKEYFYVAMEMPAWEARGQQGNRDNHDRAYETAPYVPLPSNDLCVTVSLRFADSTGADRVLCLHLEVQRGLAQTLPPSPQRVAADAPELKRRYDGG